MTLTDPWPPVDRLTKPTRRHITRSRHARAGDLETETAADLLHALANDPQRTVCHVADYRRAVRHLGLQSTRSATVPALWDQAAAAVDGIGETGGEGGTAPKRERSVADLTLMDTLYKIRVAVGDQLATHNTAPRSRVTDQIRQVTSVLLLTGDEQVIDWWARKVDHWVRTITAQLNDVDNGPKPFRLRNAACPECAARQVRVFEQDEWRLVPPLRIDFRDGAVRAAQCSACAHAWFRGDDLRALADTLNGGAVVAEDAGVSA